MAVKIRERNGRWWRAFAVVLLVASSAGAASIQKWRTPDGGAYFGSEPPGGSVLVGEYDENPEIKGGRAFNPDVPTPADSDSLASFDARAIVERRQIERDSDAIAIRLKQVRAEIDRVRSTVLSQRTDTPEGVASYYETRRALEAEIARLQEVEKGVVAELNEQQERFVVLTESVRKAYGGRLPATWHAQLRCRNCE